MMRTAANPGPGCCFTAIRIFGVMIAIAPGIRMPVCRTRSATRCDCAVHGFFMMGHGSSKQRPYTLHG